MELVVLELQIKDLSAVKAALTTQATQMVAVAVVLAVLVFDLAYPLKMELVELELLLLLLGLQ
jgi:hypothetical protein